MIDRARAASWVERGCMWLAVLVPFLVALSRAADTPQWRDDLPMSRAAALVVSPGAGLVSTLVLASSSLLPIGTRSFRGALVSVFLLALACWLLFRIARRALDEVLPAPFLNPVLAAATALTAGLSPVVAREATVAGGAMPVLCLALLGILALPSTGQRDARRFVAAGACVAAAALESPAVALVLVLALSAHAAVRGRVDLPAVGHALVGVGLVALLLAAPLVLRAAMPRAWADVGASPLLSALLRLDVVGLRSRGIGSWTSDLGVVALALTTLGLVSGIVRAWARWVVLPFAVVLLADLLVPAQTAGVLSADPLAGVRALAVVGAAVLSALGVHAVATTLLATRLVFARPAAVLSVAFFVALAAVGSEEAHASADRSSSRAAEAWTVQAIERLPPSSIVLVRADAVAWRFWAAQLVSGVRPDITVVPMPLLGNGRLAVSLLREEPMLAPLLRDLSATGEPSEYALSSIADARPLYVELDPRWDRRLAMHVMADKLWLRFAPQPLGATDRKLAQSDDAAAVERVLASAPVDEGDPATVEVIAAHTREQLLAASLVGDKDAVARAGAQLTAIGREPTAQDLAWGPPEVRRPARAGSTRRFRLAAIGYQLSAVSGQRSAISQGAAARRPFLQTLELATLGGGGRHPGGWRSPPWGVEVATLGGGARHPGGWSTPP